MILSSFKYKVDKWELNKISPIHNSCLIVGRNSVGKSRTINAIQNVVAFVMMKEVYINSYTFSTELEFVGDNTEVKYAFSVNDGVLEKELLEINNNVIIKRTAKIAKFNGENIAPPKNKLIIQVRRDNKQYPEIEKLIGWFEGVVWVSYSNINPSMILTMSRSANPLAFSALVESMDERGKKNVIKSARALDYNVSDISLFKENDGFKCVRIKEKGISESILEWQLSNGMLRTLYLLCFVEYIKKSLSPKPSLLLIDDMSEGLDYHRSVELGKMIFDNCEKYGLQIIASSNDAFLMDAISISNWQILLRKASKVDVINQYNNEDLFAKFRMTGLSNFDLFSSDFINNYIDQLSK